jgi:hypothetical protein
MWRAIVILALLALPPRRKRKALSRRRLDVWSTWAGIGVHLHCTGSGGPTVMVVGAGFSVDWALVQADAAKFTTMHL